MSGNPGEQGTARTREFYDRKGWETNQAGDTVDRELFGVKEDGPIRIELHRSRQARIEKALQRAGRPLDVLEVGCGGAPEEDLLRFCRKYVGVDFSEKGIELAKAKLSGSAVPHELHVADACQLPFQSGQFDAVYCAHMIYHIEDPSAQRRAISEIIRVTRSGGQIIIIAANSRPLMDPPRLLIRLAANAPGSQILRRLKGNRSPIPYNPQTIGFMLDALSEGCKVNYYTGGMPSTAFNQRVSEFKNPGALAWRALRKLELNYPVLSARLGNYVTYICEKT